MMVVKMALPPKDSYRNNSKAENHVSLKAISVWKSNHLQKRRNGHVYSKHE